MVNQVRQVLDRLGDYAWWQVIIEFAVIWLAVYAVARFVRGTRAAGAIKGLLVLSVAILLLLGIFGQSNLFPRLSILIQWFLGFAAFGLLVIFAPEIRRGLLRLGERAVFFGQAPDVGPVVEAVVSSCHFLGKNRFGAIIAIERRVGLRDAIENGHAVNGDVSAHLLNSIFWPNTPLHDMGVVIRGDKIVAASVPFPLADPNDLPDEHMGTRHRAALGLSRQTDAIVIVVSEETGAISVAEGGRLDRWLTTDLLRTRLLATLEQAKVDQIDIDEGAAATPRSDEIPSATATKSPTRDSDGNPKRRAVGGITGA